MNDGPKNSDPLKAAKWVAISSLALLVLTNAAWVIAYSGLSQRSIGVDSGAYSSSPAASKTATPSASPSASPVVMGTISGSVGYPAGTAPAQTVCAVKTTDATVKVCVDHAAGSALAYNLNVPAGTYYVYASLKAAQGDFTTSYKAYYNQYVACQTSGNCAAGLHGQYIPVTITGGAMAVDVDPTDWYAQGLGQ